MTLETLTPRHWPHWPRTLAHVPGPLLHTHWPAPYVIGRACVCVCATGQHSTATRNGASEKRRTAASKAQPVAQPVR